MALLLWGLGKNRVRRSAIKKMEEGMWPVNVKTDPAPRNEGPVGCEPAGESDGTSSQGYPRPETTSDVDERAPEEAGYGYGV
jgi:hypothetical protein